MPDLTKTLNDLRTDQLYILEMCEAVNKGDCEERLEKRKTGKVCHSRWLFTANSIHRLYVATENPLEKLKIYAPMWFRIKTHPSCIYGAKHLY
jgi:hypothetical protein